MYVCIHTHTHTLSVSNKRKKNVKKEKKAKATPESRSSFLDVLMMTATYDLVLRVCVWEREWVCERECEWVSEWVCVCEWVSEWVSACVCVCVCVCVLQLRCKEFWCMYPPPHRPILVGHSCILLLIHTQFFSWAATELRCSYYRGGGGGGGGADEEEKDNDAVT